MSDESMSADDIKTMVALALKEALPAIITAAQTSLKASDHPAAAVAVPIVIDEIDTLINDHLGRTAPKTAVAAPSDPESRLARAEQAIAALAIATGKAYGSFQAQRAAVAANVAAKGA